MSLHSSFSVLDSYGGFLDQLHQLLPLQSTWFSLCGSSNPNLYILVKQVNKSFYNRSLRKINLEFLIVSFSLSLLGLDEIYGFSDLSTSPPTGGGLVSTFRGLPGPGRRVDSESLLPKGPCRVPVPPRSWVDSLTTPGRGGRCRLSGAITPETQEPGRGRVDRKTDSCRIRRTLGTGVSVWGNLDG